MKLATTTALGVLAALALGAAPAQADDVSLDLRGERVVTSSLVLPAGSTYAVRVTGTGSIWSRTAWESAGTPCGASEVAPMFPSEDGTTGPVGWDAETIFAVPPGGTPGYKCLPAQMPRLAPRGPHGGLQIDSGSGFTHVDPVGGPVSAPAADHSYVYAVPSTGAALRFRFLDAGTNVSFSGDNYGVFSVQVRDAVAASAPSSSRPAVESTALSQSLPAARKCLSRRNFPIRVRAPKGVAFRSATLSIGTKRIASVRTSKLVRANIDLRGRAAGRYTVKARIETSRGQVLAAERRYRTCVPKSQSKKSKR